MPTHHSCVENDAYVQTYTSSEPEPHSRHLFVFRWFRRHRHRLASRASNHILLGPRPRGALGDLERLAARRSEDSAASSGASGGGG